MQVGSNRVRSGLMVEGLSQKFGEDAHLSNGIGHKVGVLHREDSHLGTSSELSLNAVKLRGVGVAELLFVQFCAAAALASEHGFLGGCHLGEISFHEDDLIMLVGRKMRKQLGD